jgi:polysaccharide pyruvyl transferase WcaK-like protein
MEESNRKIVRITGAGFGNKGAEAMLLTVAEAVRNNLPDAEIVARVRSMDFAQTAGNARINLEMEPPRTLVRRIITWIKAPKIRCQAAAVIDIGGYQFGDPWGANYAKNKARQIKNWIRSGQPVFFLPQAWGPFSSGPAGKAVASIINTATLSFARDKTSLDEIQKLVGSNHPGVRFAHDIAWNFKGDDLIVGKQLITDAGFFLNEDKLTVCLTPNTQVYSRIKSATGHQNEYIILLSEIASHLCKARNAQVILLGHQFVEDNSERKDDRTLCNYIMSSLDKSLPVIHLDKTLSAAQIKSVIGNCDLLLSSRYHALIAAMSQGIPSAAIGWSHKYDELMSEVGLSSSVISLSKTKENILRDVDLIVKQTAQAKETLKSTVPQMKQSGQKALDDVISAIKDKFAGINGCRTQK